jgi:hypothetical protein
MKIGIGFNRLARGSNGGILRTVNEPLSSLKGVIFLDKLTISCSRNTLYAYHGVRKLQNLRFSQR